MIRVCALASGITGHHEQISALERSLSRQRVPFFLHVDNAKWTWTRKLQWELELASTHPLDHFVFIDAYDFLFVGRKDELDSIVSQGLVILPADAGDIPLWPEALYVDQVNLRRKATTRWRWVNGSGPAGLGRDIARIIKWGFEHMPMQEPPETDQTFWTKVFAAGYCELDQNCVLTQPLIEADFKGGHITEQLGIRNGRLTNLETLTTPQFLHATANSWWAIPKELLP